MKKTLAIIALMTLVAGCGGNPDGVAGQAFWQAIVAHIVELVVLIATPIIAVLIRKLVRVLEDKTSIDIAERQEALIDGLVNKGIAYAHEQARKALKEGQDPMDGDTKKNAAVDFVAEALTNTGAASLGADALAKLVEAKLNIERAPEDTEKPASNE